MSRHVERQPFVIMSGDTHINMHGVCCISVACNQYDELFRQKERWQKKKEKKKKAQFALYVGPWTRTPYRVQSTGRSMIVAGEAKRGFHNHKIARAAVTKRINQSIRL